MLIADKHLLSLRDLNRSALVSSMLDAGVSSFKIEGRLKDAAYVKNTVSAYRDIIDRAIASAPDGMYRRASDGTSAITFTPDLSQSFNRGYTDYFSTIARPDVKMASIDTPKWTGLPVGKVLSCKGRTIRASLNASLNNGDGLGYFDAGRRFHGFRINRVDGQTLYAASDIDIPRGTTLYRNHDRLRQSALESDTARRTIGVALTLRPTPFGLALDAKDQTGVNACATAEFDLQEAKKPQTEARLTALKKSGDTVFTITDVSDMAGNYFVPLSILTDLRRRALEALTSARKAARPIDYRRAPLPDLTLPDDMRALTYHDNVANRVAADFYRRCGATQIDPALEVSTSTPRSDLRVMTTRYCLRREMGRCLRTPSGRLWPEPLYLKSGPNTFRLGFDCTNCRMTLTIPSKE